MSAPSEPIGFKEPVPPPYSPYPVQGPPPYVHQPASGYPSQVPPGYGPYVPPSGQPYVPPQNGRYYGATTVIIPHDVTDPTVVVVGGCPNCRVGYLRDEFSCLGIFCAIFFFPIGILCCLAMRDRRCGNCGSTF